MLDSTTNILHAANIGDSGFLLMRKNGQILKTVARSAEQCHQFNFPYQIGTGGDHPSKAEVYTADIENNDIVVLGTDGYYYYLTLQ